MAGLKRIPSLMRFVSLGEQNEREMGEKCEVIKLKNTNLVCKNKSFGKLFSI